MRCDLRLALSSRRLLHAVRVRAEQPARGERSTGSSASEWRAPMVVHRAGRVRARLRVRRVRDGAELVAARRVARAHAQPPSADATEAPLPPAPSIGEPRCPSTRRAMDFDLQWLLLGLPVAFALGWLGFALRPAAMAARAARFAQGLLQGPEPAAQRAAGQGDRRLHRGRAARPRHLRPALRARQPVSPPRRIRARGARARAPAAAAPTCRAAERDRAQHALAQDFMKAGLLDRAEEAFKALEGTAFDTEARLALLTPARALARLARRRRRSRSKLEQQRHRLVRVAHRALLVRARARSRRASSRPPTPTTRCARARDAAPQAAAAAGAGRPARMRAPAGSARRSQLWGELLRRHTPRRFNARRARLRRERAGCGERAARVAATARALPARADRWTCCMRIAAARRRCRERSASALLDASARASDAVGRAGAAAPAERECRPTPTQAQPVRDAVARAAKPLQRYRCAACGFEAQHYFWQCPGCLSWDSYPPQRLEDL